MMTSRSTSSNTSMFFYFSIINIVWWFLPPRYHSLVGAYLEAFSSNSSSNMSTGVINPTNEGLAFEQFINMISDNVGNP